MSSSEQARADAARIDVMDDLRPDDNGDFVTSRDFIRRFVSRLPGTERSGMIDAGGQLSQAGYARIRNAVLAKAYGDSPVLVRMVESMDDAQRNLGKALVQSAPEIAKMRQDIADGALYGADITPDLLAAVDEINRLKESGRSVSDALAQGSMFGAQYSPEQRSIMAFLDANLRKPRKVAEFIQVYVDGLRAAGNPSQASLLDGNPAPAKMHLLDAATNADKNEWVSFPANFGTLGISRADMPQVKSEHRGALIAYDAVMWQMLASKQRFIDQALSGDSSVRSIDDLSESSQFQIATAMTSDDERAIQLAGLRAEIEKLQRLYRAHEEQRMRMKQEYDWAGETIRINEQNLPEATKAADRVEDLSGDNFKAKADGRAFAVRKEFGEALMARFKDFADKLGQAPVKIGEISGFDIMATGRTGQGNGYQAGVFLSLPEPVVLTEAATADPVGVALKASNALAGLSRLPAQMRQKIDEANAKRNALEARITAPFPMAEMLSDKIKEAQDLEGQALHGRHTPG